MFANSYHTTILVAIQVAAIIAFAFLFFRAHQARQTRRHEMSKRILDKMSSEEFLEVLRSPEGRRSVEKLIGSEKSTEAWITDAIRRAILLLCGGAALLSIHPFLDFSGDEIPLIVGGLSIGVGIGYLVAAMLTRGRAHGASGGATD